METRYPNHRPARKKVYEHRPRLASAEKPRYGCGHMSDLRSQINSLSAAEKAELLDTLWESLEADSASLTDAQRAELDHRIARHEQNPSEVIPWQQVRAGLFRTQ
jgi:putative addiction module component (TIGR02574 family)